MRPWTPCLQKQEPWHTDFVNAYPKNRRASSLEPVNRSTLPTYCQATIDIHQVFRPGLHAQDIKGEENISILFSHTPNQLCDENFWGAGPPGKFCPWSATPSSGHQKDIPVGPEEKNANHDFQMFFVEHCGLEIQQGKSHILGNMGIFSCWSLNARRFCIFHKIIHFTKHVRDQILAWKAGFSKISQPCRRRPNSDREPKGCSRTTRKTSNLWRSDRL